VSGSESDVAYAGVAGQARLLAEGRLTATELADLVLRRIDRLEPRLNAFRTVLADDARRDAAAADAARRAGDTRPLLGVPIAVKDTTPVAGRPALVGTGSPEAPAAADGELVRRLRAAGMVLVGLTHLPELALWAATESLHHGVTRNPWDRRRAPGGSSGGSAVAVAAGMVPAATATDGLGSIRLPAAACGLVGLKPTHGTVPLDPDPDHWAGLSHAGFLTRCVSDTVLLLQAAGRPDVVGEPPAGPLRIAVSDRGVLPVRIQPEVRRVVASAVNTLQGMGHTTTVRHPPYGAIGVANGARFLAGMARDIEALADPMATERRTRQLAGAGRLVPARAVRRARAEGESFAARMADFFTDADVLVTPTTPRLPVAAGSIVGRGVAPTVWAMLPQAVFTSPWNGAGLPAMNVPFGTTADGFPVGVQLVGPAGSESTLLGLATALERQVHWPDRRPPVDMPA
jgi:amidase